MRQGDVARKDKTERLQYAGGSGTKPRKPPSQVNGRAIPTAPTTMVVVMSAALARLSRNGIFAVRMMWMMSVWVSRDSTNQPLWNKAGLLQALKQ